MAKKKQEKKAASMKKGAIVRKSKKEKPAEKPTKVRRKKAEEKAPVLMVRKWSEPEIIEISKEAWERPGTRVGYFSYGAYGKDGWRKGLNDLAGAIFAMEGCKFPVYAGGLISKEWLQAEIKRLAQGVPRKFHAAIAEHVKTEAMQALRAILPRFKKPDGTFARWYCMTSNPFDGICGELIVRMLQEARSEDIRQYETGGESIEIPQPGKESLYHGVVLPKKSRLGPKYMSAKIEPDIEDIEDQTSRIYPHIWVHGTSALAIMKPAGERMISYISLPALHKLEAKDKKTAENQIGCTIVEEMPNGDRLVHFWSFRDLIAREREFVTGIKEGASELHKHIVDVIRKEGARHPGRIADKLGIDRATLDREIKFLVEPKRSLRLTWPGLHYNEASQRYDFHKDWFQEMLRYALPKDKDEWREDSFLFFGCMHAGYTTTDYEFLVQKFPEYILKYDIRVLCGVGDFIAGLQHGLLHKGEVLHLNNTDQEKFAGEIIATVIYKVFTERFTSGLGKLSGQTPTPLEILACVDESLLLFLIKKGNHDRWQEYDGNTALEKFYDTLISLLTRHLTTFLMEKGFGVFDIEPIVRKKTVLLPEHDPVYTLPSGIRVGLTHPHMARADTTSLRAEKALKKFSQKHGCQVVGSANYHVAAIAHKWWLNVGQCVSVQTATEVILTDFEFNKLKDLDFGPIYLRALSHKGRLFKTTLAAFNAPILKEPIPKWTNVLELKQKLGLLGYTSKEKK